MINVNDLFNIICTEALEHGGIQEVPDQQYGSINNYHDLKRNARARNDIGEVETVDELPPIHFTLELIKGADGKPMLIE